MCDPQDLDQSYDRSIRAYVEGKLRRSKGGSEFRESDHVAPRDHPIYTRQYAIRREREQGNANAISPHHHCERLYTLSTTGGRLLDPRLSDCRLSGSQLYPVYKERLRLNLFVKCMISTSSVCHGTSGTIHAVCANAPWLGHLAEHSKRPYSYSAIQVMKRDRWALLRFACVFTFTAVVL